VQEAPPESPDEENRTVWIRCHPSIFSTALSTLKGAVSLTLDTLKKSLGRSQNSYSVEIIDLRDSINVFEITGPKSSQVVHGALTPTIANYKDEFKKVRYIDLSLLLIASAIYSSFGCRYLTCKARVLSQAT
jgi:ribonuclease P/MRP protein subunit POP1